MARIIIELSLQFTLLHYRVLLQWLSTRQEVLRVWQGGVGEQVVHKLAQDYLARKPVAKRCACVVSASRSLEILFMIWWIFFSLHTRYVPSHTFPFSLQNGDRKADRGHSQKFFNMAASMRNTTIIRLKMAATNQRECMGDSKLSHFATVLSAWSWHFPRYHIVRVPFVSQTDRIISSGYAFSHYTNLSTSYVQSPYKASYEVLPQLHPELRARATRARQLFPACQSIDDPHLKAPIWPGRCSLWSDGAFSVETGNFGASPTHYGAVRNQTSLQKSSLAMLLLSNG